VGIYTEESKGRVDNIKDKSLWEETEEWKRLCHTMILVEMSMDDDVEFTQKI
jgi:hypothetical protein